MLNSPSGSKMSTNCFPHAVTATLLSSLPHARSQSLLSYSPSEGTSRWWWTPRSTVDTTDSLIGTPRDALLFTTAYRPPWRRPIIVPGARSFLMRLSCWSYRQRWVQYDWRKISPLGDVYFQFWLVRNSGIGFCHISLKDSDSYL